MKAKRFLVMSIFIYILSFFKVNYVSALDEKYSNIDIDKTWTVTFSKKISYDTAARLIKVTDVNGEKVSARLKLEDDGKTIKVKAPIRGYIQGETYTLNVERGIYSKNRDKKLTESKKVNFRIKCENPFKNMTSIEFGDTVNSRVGRKYIFNRIHKLSGLNGKSLEEIGWNLRGARYNKLKGLSGVVTNTTNAQNIQLPFKLNGWLGVCIGYLSDTEEITLKVKNKNIEKTYINYNYKKNRKNKYINEAFVFANNFKDDVIEVCPKDGKTTNIAYVKLVSLNNEQIKAYNEKEDSVDSNVIYDNDGFTDFFWGRYPTVESLERLPVNLLEKVDSNEVNWNVGTTGLLNYNSKYAGYPFEDFCKYESELREGDKRARDQVVNIIYTSGKSTLSVVADSGKKIGVKVNGCLRMNSFFSNGFTRYLNGSVYDQYTDCLQNGDCRLSYYYPKFRNYILNILEEISDTKNVDGITLDFCRGPYIMGSEATLEEKIDIMNYFMKKVRREIPSKKITVRFPYLDPKSYGLDVETWVNEGLVDRIIPSVISYEDFFDLNKYSKLVKGTNVELYLGISANVEGRDATKDSESLDEDGKLPGNKYLTPEEYIYRAYEGYKAGAKGIFMFNTLNALDLEKNVSPMYKLIGNKAKVNKWYQLEYESYLVNYKVDLYV